MLSRNKLRLERHNRIRSKLKGTTVHPRVSVFVSLNHIYAQLIDDSQSKTIVSASDFELKDQKADVAKEVGKLLAERAKEKKITKVVFDRSGYKYHGKVKNLAESIRENGLRF
ncbi:MAG: 50S ribosomal protein L18 [bacterium]|nr:50S ribosomal protein L18 [bacterium]